METAMTKRDDPRSCMLQLAQQTPSCLILLTGTVTAAMIAGLAGAALAALVALVTLFVLARASWFRALVRDADAERVRAARQRRRARTLTAAGVPPWTLGQLNTLASEVARKSPRDAEAFDLEGLLDHYVALECEHQRIEQSLATVELGSMMRALQALPETPSPRRQVLERRLALWSSGRARATALADSINTTSELIHLIAQRVEMHGTDVDSSRIDACLEQLAAEDEVSRDLDPTR